MPRKSNKAKKMRQNPKGKGRGNRRGGQVNREIGNSKVNRPDLVLWTNQTFTTTVTSSGIRFDIVPTASTFSADVQQTMDDFQRYRISKIELDVMPLQPVNTTSIDPLNPGVFYKNNPPFIQVIKLTSDRIPPASFAGFGAASAVTSFVATKPRRFTVSPFVNTSGDAVLGQYRQRVYVSTNDKNQLHYGLTLFAIDLDNGSSGLRISSQIVFRVRCCLELFGYIGNAFGFQKSQPNYSEFKCLQQMPLRKAPICKERSFQQMSEQQDVRILNLFKKLKVTQ